MTAQSGFTVNLFGLTFGRADTPASVHTTLRENARDKPQWHGIRQRSLCRVRWHYSVQPGATTARDPWSEGIPITAAANLAFTRYSTVYSRRSHRHPSHRS